jgi:hypothetical protein
MRASVPGIPETDALVWFRIREDARLPAQLLALPPPVSPRDGGDGGALIAHSLIRQWASSDAALLGAVQRRLVRAESLSAALDDGTWPSKSELSSWIAGDDAVQLGFPGLLSAPAPGAGELASHVRAHASGLRAIRDRARLSTADDERVNLIRRIRTAHSGRKIVAFSQYTDTVNGLFDSLCGDGEVAVLSGAGARVAGGSISRTEVIERFAPRASGRAAPSRSSVISLLLATDLLSEGINLQDAGVVIHLDLPWTPARMEQRLGRIARVGSTYERVQAYAIHPPMSADYIARIEAILRSKLEAAGIAIGDFHSLKGWASPAVHPAQPRITETLRARLRQWRSASVRSHEGMITSAVESASRGFLAIVRGPDESRLIASLEGSVTDDPHTVLRAAALCEGDDRTFACQEMEEAERQIAAFLGIDAALGTARLSSTRGAGVRNTAVRRINRFVQNARPHIRASAAVNCESARQILLGNLSAYQEMELERLSSVECDTEWVDGVIAIGASGKRPWSEEPGDHAVQAIILLG